MKTLFGAHLEPGVMLDVRTGRSIDYFAAEIGPGALVRSNTVIYCNVRIGKGLETGHNVVIREECVIGENLAIWNNSVIDYGCSVGHNVRIHCNVYVSQHTVIEDDVFVAPGVTIANDLHPICTHDMRGPTIKRRARIGCNATLLPRIVIGESALIGAGSVVTADVPAEMVVVGNPAVVICSIHELRCQQGNVDRPYIDGFDVLTRESQGISVNPCLTESSYGD